MERYQGIKAMASLQHGRSVRSESSDSFRETGTCASNEPTVRCNQVPDCDSSAAVEWFSS